MAIVVRYLTVREGSKGALPRYFWQPSTKLREKGWRIQRVPANWADYADAAQLLGAAIAAAQELNAVLDARHTPGSAATAAPAIRTLGMLITAYKGSSDYLRLAPKTRRDYLQCLDRLDTWGGAVPVVVLSAAQVGKLYDTLGRTAMAAAVVRVLRLLLEHGVRLGWLRINPAIRPKLKTVAPTGLIWPREAVAAFVATADAMKLHSIGTAILINEWLGQREGDILRLPRAALRNGTLLVRQNKTGAGVALPVHLVGHIVQRLREEAVRVHTAAGDGTVPLTVIVSEETGHAYLSDNFRHVFARVRAKVAQAYPQGFAIDHLMPGRDMTDPDAFTIRATNLTFMSLRHTAITRYAEAECHTSLIASISGHSQATVTQIIERYMVRTATIARLAFQRRMDAESGAVSGAAEGKSA